MTVLSTARSMSYGVGTNLKGRGLAGTWTFVLPSLEVETAVVLGRPATTDLDVVRRLSSRCIVINQSSSPSGGNGLGGHRVDLVVLADGADRILSRVPALRDSLTRSLSPRGAVYRERRGPPRAAEWPLCSLSFVIAPAHGPARVLVPALDGATVARLAALGFVPPRGRQDPLHRALNRVAATRPLRRRWQRRAELLLGPDARPEAPPAYVVDIAAKAGVSIEAMPWAIVAPGDYASQKVLLLLFDGEQRRPSTIVKLSRDAAHAERLRNEAAALTHLSRLDIEKAAVPELRFAGSHAGRAVVGESWLSGRPFSAATAPTLKSDVLAAATGWLKSLAEATVTRRDARDIGAALRDLFVRFGSTYGLLADEIGFLESQVRAVEWYDGSLPVVMQHGDPGTWNVLVDDSGRVAFLDWESAETTGIPLWDLLHFQRSYGALAARREGVRRRIEASAHHLTTTSPLNARFADDIAEHAAAVDLPTSLIEALFFTAWMHRALKEATRRTPTTLHRAFYLRLLVHLVRHRGSPGVRRLVGQGR